MPRTSVPEIGILAIVFALSSVSLQAQVIPGRWEKLDATVQGTEIVVRLRTTTRIEGTFQESTSAQVTVVTDSGTTKIAKGDILEITTAQPYRDGLKNGALIGGGIGLGVALGLLAVASSGKGYVLESAKWAGPLFGFGVGLGTGVAIDAARKQREVLYRAR